MQRRSAKNRHSNARTPAETKIREPSGRKSPQKRAIRRRAGNVRFAETGWWRRSGPNWLLPTQGSNQVSETRVRNGIFCCKGHTFESCRVRHFSFVLQRDMRDPTKTPAPAHSSESAI